jgi:UDP-N-acetylglucosamine acyltransferase
MTQFDGNVVHGTAIIGPDVVIGRGNRIDQNVVISGSVTIGDNNWICANVIIGASPEIRSVRPDSEGFLGHIDKGVVIGHNNVVREAVQIHAGDNVPTRIGNDVYLMNQVYVAHDCQLDDGATIASSALLAGNVRVKRGANIGLGAKIHQGIVIGPISMVGMGAVVTRPVPAFAKVFGTPARVQGVNTVGISRMGFAESVIDSIVSRFSAHEYFSESEAILLIDEFSVAR